MDATHVKKVKNLQKQISEYYTRKVPFRVYHGSSNSTRKLTFKRSEMVDTSQMNRVLYIDREKNVAVVEPNVSMKKLVKETLKYGLIPPVVPELFDITVGGAIQGGAAESSSFKWGSFGNNLNWIEIVLGNGHLIKASSSEHSGIFYGTAGSYGSMGLITAVELQLIPAKKYVKVKHFQVTSLKEAIKFIDQYIEFDNCDFIECVMIREDLGAIVIGSLAEDVEGDVLRFTRARDPWYYFYALDILNIRKKATDTIPLREYLFRFDRGAFWTGKLIYDHLGIPFNRFTRFLLDPFMRAKKLYQAVQASGAGQVFFCQDIVVPKENLLQFVEFIDTEFGMYPLAFCPLKPEPNSQLQFNCMNTDMAYNVGIYGFPFLPYEKFVEVNRRFEAKTKELGGRKWLYAHSYYSEDEFWQIYDKKWYDNLRRKYHATTLPSIYERTVVKERYRLSKKRALLKTIFGRSKLRIVD